MKRRGKPDKCQGKCDCLTMEKINLRESAVLRSKHEVTSSTLIILPWAKKHGFLFSHLSFELDA